MFLVAISQRRSAICIHYAMRKNAAKTVMPGETIRLHELTDTEMAHAFDADSEREGVS
jgi:hypothetical protein